MFTLANIRKNMDSFQFIFTKVVHDSRLKSIQVTDYQPVHSNST